MFLQLLFRSSSHPHLVLEELEGPKVAQQNSSGCCCCNKKKSLLQSSCSKLSVLRNKTVRLHHPQPVPLPLRSICSASTHSTATHLHHRLMGKKQATLRLPANSGDDMGCLVPWLQKCLPHPFQICPSLSFTAAQLSHSKLQRTGAGGIL